MTVASSARDHGALPLLIGVTGHRDVPKEDVPPLEEAVRAVFRELRRRFPHTPLVLLSPLAEGADRIAARVALQEGARLHVPLPMPLALYATDFATDSSRSEFKDLLARAEQVVELPLLEGQTAATIAEPGPARNRQYDTVGEYIAQHSQVLLALWSGEPARHVGGTADIVRRRLTDIPRSAATHLHPPDPVHSGPVYQIVTPRQGLETPAGALTLQKHFPVGLLGEKVPGTTYDKLFGQLEAFNRDVVRRRKSGEIDAERSKSFLFPATESAQLPKALGLTRECFGVADALATYFQRRFFRSTAIVFLLVFLAVVVYEILDHLFDMELHGLLVYPTVLAIAFAAFYWAKWHDYANRYQDYRGLAEGLRVQFFWRLAGLNAAVEDNYLRKHRGEMNWIRTAIRICWSLQGGEATSLCAPHSPEEARQRLEWVTAHWLDDQHAFFQRRALREERRKEILEWLIRGGLALGIAVSLIVGGTLLFHPPTRIAAKVWVSDHEWIRGVVGLTIALAMIGAALLHRYVESQSITTIARQYKVMELLFETARGRLKELGAAATPDECQKLLEALGKEALAENADWVLIHRDRPLEVPHGK